MESFTEMRSTSKAVEGVTLGQFLQQQQSTSGTSHIGLTPWDYAMDPPEDFVEQVYFLSCALAIGQTEYSSHNYLVLSRFGLY